MKRGIWLLICIAGLQNSLYAQFPGKEDSILRNKVIQLAAENKKEEALTALYKIDNSTLRVTAMGDYVEKLIEKEQVKDGVIFGNRMLDSLRVLRETRETQYLYQNFITSYAKILMEKSRYKEALPLLDEVTTTQKSLHFSVYGMHVKAMYELKHYEQAVLEIQKMIIKGRASMYVTDTLFRLAYIGWTGSEKGFNTLKDTVNHSWKLALREESARDSVNRTAPLFAIKDASGNIVSLASFKGKTVLLDFWANWCMPCKASFPVMKQVQDRFKNDPNVVFLFIHCMEREADPIPQAVSYMETHHFDFKVLFDLRDDAKESPVAKSYGVRGIPTKCVIDPAGNIRFVSVGGVKYTDSDAQAVERICTMIEMAAGK